MFKYALPLIALLVACQPSEQATQNQSPSQLQPQVPQSSAPVLPATQSQEISGSLIADEKLGSTLPLASTVGKDVVLNAPADKISLVAFGYTRCPDVCPTTLVLLKNAVKKLSDDEQKRLTVYFVTLDPERDTIDVLKDYVTLFHPDFVGLRPQLAQLEQLKSEWRVVGNKVPTKNDNYTVDHSTGIYFIDKQGQTAVYEPYGTTAQQLATDISLFLQQNP